MGPALLLASDAGGHITGQAIVVDGVYYGYGHIINEGFFDLEGDAQLKQTVLNLNAVYMPRKNWSIRPSIRFENLHQEAIAEFEETNIGAGPAFAAIVPAAYEAPSTFRNISSRSGRMKEKR